MPKINHEWEDRRVGTGHEQASNLLANPNNWRIHPGEQQAAMEGALDSVGWVGSVKVNRTTGHILDGHLRTMIALRKGDDTPIPVDYYELSEEEENLVLATFDPISAMAGQDDELLAGLVQDMEELAPGLDAMFADMLPELYGGDNDGSGDENNYTRKVEAPVYEITGERPDLEELYDDSKTRKLMADIEAADLPDNLYGFLKSAAERHTVFNFDKIAEYYAHADYETQQLLEASALIIIDFDRAIEQGFIKLTSKLAEQYAIDKEKREAEQGGG